MHMYVGSNKQQQSERNTMFIFIISLEKYNSEIDNTA